MSKSNKSICNLFETLVNRMLRAEEHICDQLQKICSIAQANELKTIFETHITETEHQIQRLKDCLKYLDENLPKEEQGLIEKGKNTLKEITQTALHQKSEAIDGVIKEGEHIFKEYEDTNLHDFVLSSGALSLEMGEITAYNTLIALATECGFKEIQDLLKETLEEEKHAYDSLKAFAEEEAKKNRKSA